MHMVGCPLSCRRGHAAGSKEDEAKKVKIKLEMELRVFREVTIAFYLIDSNAKHAD